MLITRGEIAKPPRVQPPRCATSRRPPAPQPAPVPVMSWAAGMKARAVTMSWRTWASKGCGSSSAEVYELGLLLLGGAVHVHADGAVRKEGRVRAVSMRTRSRT